MTTIETDTEYEDAVLESVKKSGDGYEITHRNGWCFYCPGGVVKPKKGDTARFYGRGIGSPVRGLAINGKVVFYRTDEEDRAHDEEMARQREAKQRQNFEDEGRAVLDAQYETLPYPFRWRIDRFRSNNPDFRWRFEEYEMTSCVDAVKIAEALKAPEAIDEWNKLDWEPQMAAVPGLYQGHSGNSFGVAVGLAKLYLTNPEAVAVQHGALCVLSGCEEYGCEPRKAKRSE